MSPQREEAGAPVGGTLLVDLQSPMLRAAIAHEIPGYLPGFTIKEVDSWPQAKEAAQGAAEHPCVLLLSLTIPGLTSISELDEWHMSNPWVKVVLVIPETDRELVMEAMNARPHSVISDDFTVGQLGEILDLVSRGFYVFHNPEKSATEMSWIFPRRPPRGIASPSPRELKVLQVMSSGLTEKETAALLQMRPRTVQSHMEHVKNKLGARNRLHAVSLAIAWGFVSPIREKG